MTFWIPFWKFILIFGLIAFAIIATFVTITGISEIKKLLK